MAPEEPAVHVGEEVAESDASAGHRTGKLRVFLFFICLGLFGRVAALAMLTSVVDVVALGGGGGDAGGAGSSHGAAPSRPHGKDSVAPRARASKRMADLAEPGRPAKKRRGKPTPVPVLSG